MSALEAFVFFCDDIRFEVGNKASLMGLYGHDMVFHTTEPPSTVARLGVAVAVRWQSGIVLQPVTIEVVLPDASQQRRTTLSPQNAELKKAEAEAIAADAIGPEVMANFIFESVAVRIDRNVKVIMHHGDQSRVIGVLRMLHRPIPGPEHHAAITPKVRQAGVAKPKVRRRKI